MREPVRNIKYNTFYILVTGVLLVILLMIVVINRVRRIQQHLRLANENLENQVLERTEQLSQANDELKQYVDVIDKYVITSSTDRHGVITETFEAFCRVSKYSPQALIGKTHSMIRHPDTPDSIYNGMWKTIAQGKTWHGELKNRARDGSDYWVDVSIEPKFDSRRKIIGYTAIRQDITDRKRVEELSVTDPLTGIFNRLKLDDTLNREIERVSRYPQNLSIILFDIDQFKQINDKYGHLAGDSVLVDIANTTASRTREIDIAGRWGGEEFLVICPETDLEGARRLAEDMRIAISEHAFSHERPITCSFGVASFHVSESVTSLIKRADEALYRAKGNGRNRVETSV